MDRELELIKNEKIRLMVKTVLDNLPDYFWTVPASSSGKYHPATSLGNGGLVRHTKTAVKIATDLLNLKQNDFSDIDKDIIIASLILHDGLKQGRVSKGYTEFLHPLYMSEFLKELSTNKTIDIDGDILNKISSAICSHMGQWNTQRNEEKVLPIPETDIEKFVHLCDYISSKKYICLKFDEDNNIKEE